MRPGVELPVQTTRRSAPPASGDNASGVKGLSWVTRPGLTARQVLLLLVLAAALAGLFLLLEFIVSLTSTGPRDLLAGTAREDETLGVPTGVELLKYLILGVSIALAAALIMPPIWWSPRAVLRRWRALLVSVPAAAALVLAAAYLFFSGMLDDLVPYDEHLVRLTHIETRHLVVLAAVFLSVTIAGLINWKLLLASLVVWLAAIGGFGLLDSESVDGLRLFPTREIDNLPGNFGEQVRSVQQSGEADPAKLILSDVTAIATAPPVDAAVFRVSGAAHTRYLRASTGDIYEDGSWIQGDRSSVRLEQNEPVAGSLGALVQRLHRPTAAPRREFSDQIVITPIDGAELLPAGALPTAQHLRSVDVSMTYFPFSETLSTDVGLPRYGMQSRVPSFALSQRVNAAPVAIRTYLQLPAQLPPRVRELAEQITRGESTPYLKARLLQAYLQEEYGYATLESEGEAQLAEGSDPVDAFLFGRGVGTPGSFSSAFVILARATGVPARPVSGWLIRAQSENQTVYGWQAHQWAEIGLDGLGWLTIDPFPRDARSNKDVDHAWLITLEEMAASESRAVRNAVRALRKDADNGEALRRLFEAVDAVEATAARLAARSVLGALNLDRFEQMLLKHADPELREAAAYGLGLVADPNSQAALVQALAADEQAGVRESAAVALAIVGKDGAEEALLRALDSDAESAVRAASARALGALKTHATATRMLPALDSDPSAAVREAVVRALTEIKHNGALPVLLVARQEDVSATVRDAAAKALGEWEFVDVLEILEDAVEPELRAAAAHLMGERKTVEAIVPLGAALSDPQGEVREAVRAALDAIGEVTWLEHGGGVLEFEGDLAFLPDVTADSRDIASPEPIFRVRGSSHTRLLRVAAGDLYRNGRWFADEQEDLQAGASGIAFRSHDIRPRRSENAGHKNSIQVSGFGPGKFLLSGPVPISLHAQSFSTSVSYLVPSHTAFTDRHDQYAWDAIVYDHDAERLHAAELWAGAADSIYTQLPNEAWIDQARTLAAAITAKEATTYGKVRAIERYLIEEFSYLPPGSAVPVTPAGRDPVAALLFDSREGTAGALSSAFVLLARSVGIPARVVSGWAVAEQSDSQVVFADQAHQWAEVPFEGLGWVTFDPAPDGAPSRVPQDETEAFERMGAQVTRLENGGALVEHDGEAFMMPGSTAQPEGAGPRVAIYEVAGAKHTGYLRMSVGDLYEQGVWTQLDPADVEYGARSYIPSMLSTLYGDLKSLSDPAFADRLASPSLLGLQQNAFRSVWILVKVFPADGFDKVPSGTMPTSHNPRWVDLDGVLRPFSSTFSSEVGATHYTWSASARFFSANQLNRAAAVTGATTHTQLPADLPEGTRQLAEQITAGRGSVYAKAVALEQYLRANYGYAVGDQVADAAPPAGRDPVDWFLFDAQQGTAGQFSSAFVVLARSIGIPARVVSGFVILPTEEHQTVHADQAHQWAEVALDEVGWVRFDPTAPGGPPSRVPSASADGGGGSGSSEAPGSASGNPAPRAGSQTDTITSITDAPEQIRRQAPFVVGGTVQTTGGVDVGGVTVEIYINETKEHGGTKIGETTSRSGRFEAQAELPLTLDLGSYQLLARAVGNSLFNESWSDPDIQVYSGSKIELSGPTQVHLYEEAEFEGRLTDDAAVGVANRVIEVTFHGNTGLVVVTDEEGRFNFSKSFSQLGEHWVEVVLDGEELLLDNSARLSFDVVQPTQIAVYVPDAVVQGEELWVSGRVREADGQALQAGQVELTLASAERVDIVTIEVGEDGGFEHLVQSLEHTGTYTLTGRFAGAEFVLPSIAEVSFRVLRPTALTLEGPSFARDGEHFSFTGTLRESDGSPVPNAVVRVLDARPFTLMTDAEGRFAGQVRAVFDKSAAHDPYESAFRVEAVFEDSVELASSSAAWNVVVGVPQIVVEEVDAAIRGGELVIRGAVLIGTNRPVAGVELELLSGVAFTSNEAGAFTHTLSLPADEPLGAKELVIAAPGLDVDASLRFMIKSASNLIVTPVGDVSPGQTATLQVALLDDRGRGISGALLRSSQGGDATTDKFGIATVELDVPGSEDLPGNRVEFTFGGNDVHAPLNTHYFWEGAITPGGVNWQAWVRGAVLFVLLLAAGYAMRRFALRPLLGRLRRRRAQLESPTAVLAEAIESGSEARGVEDSGENNGVEAVAAAEDPQPIRVKIEFRKAAEDLPDVWGMSEEVGISVSVTDEGRPIAGADLTVSVGAAATSQLTLGEDGFGSFTWSVAEPGEHTVSAEFTSEESVVFSGSRSIQIVEFREEIVRLYGVFQDWAKQQDAGVTDESTPREVQMLLADYGLSTAERDLDNIISRFEEADYSEHEILRSQYEIMYRSLSAVVGAEQ